MPDVKSIAELWLERVLHAYPPQSVEFLRRERDPFRNPTGNRLRQAIEVLAGEVLTGADPARAAEALDSVAQIRAIEDSAPSRALDFLFELKPILREACPPAECDACFARIDAMALLAFDLYMKYRERTFEARAHEAQRRLFVLQRRLAPQETAERTE